LCIFKATSNSIEAALSPAVNAMREMTGLCGLIGPTCGANSTGLMLSDRTTCAGVTACAGQRNPSSSMAATQRRTIRKDFLLDIGIFISSI
jgi:hypothetical protein